VVSFTLLPLYPRPSSPRYPLYKRLGGPQNRTGCYEEKNLLPLQGIEPRLLGRPPRSLVAIPTELSRLPLHYKVKCTNISGLMHHVIKTYGAGGIAACILNIGNVWKLVATFTTFHPQRNSSRYLLAAQRKIPKFCKALSLWFFNYTDIMFWTSSIVWGISGIHTFQLWTLLPSSGGWFSIY
jgi:hypothetical protein